MFPAHDRASRIGGTVFAVGGKGDEQGIFQPGQFRDSRQSQFLVASTGAISLDRDSRFTTCDQAKGVLAA